MKTIKIEVVLNTDQSIKAIVHEIGSLVNTEIVSIRAEPIGLGIDEKTAEDWWEKNRDKWMCLPPKPVLCKNANCEVVTDGTGAYTKNSAAYNAEYNEDPHTPWKDRVD